MPTGIIVNSLFILCGGLAGLLAGHRLSDQVKENLNMIFGLSSIGIGISSIVRMENMPAVILSLICGTLLGMGIHLGDWINRGAVAMERAASRLIKTGPSSLSEEEFKTTLVTIIVLFCASSTGIYGSIVSGMTGDHTILITKSILDLFTAMIFACSLGAVVCLIAVPQFVLFMAVFLCAGLILPLTTPEMINDFKAAGGFIMIATGLRILKLKMFPTADMIPAMVIVMPVSWIWTSWIVPLL